MDPAVSDFARYVYGLGPRPEDEDLAGHSYGEVIAEAPLERLYVARRVAAGGANAFSTITGYEERLMGRRLVDEGAMGVRFEDDFYLWSDHGGWRLQDVAAFIRFVMERAEPGDVPELLAHAWPDYAIRKTGVEAVGERLGLSRSATRDTFLTRRRRSGPRLQVIPVAKAPAGWLDTRHGQRLPGKGES